MIFTISSCKKSSGERQVLAVGLILASACWLGMSVKLGIRNISLSLTYFKTETETHRLSHSFVSVPLVVPLSTEAVLSSWRQCSVATCLDSLDSYQLCPPPRSKTPCESRQAHSPSASHSRADRSMYRLPQPCILPHSKSTTIPACTRTTKRCKVTCPKRRISVCSSRPRHSSRRCNPRDTE